MAEQSKSAYEGADLRAVRPYIIVGNADEAIAFYRRVFAATELERYTTPTGGVGHAKLRIGETIVEIGEHPDAKGRAAERLPRVGLRLYVADVAGTYARALGAGATGDVPSNRPRERVRRVSTTRSGSPGGWQPRSSRPSRVLRRRDGQRVDVDRLGSAANRHLLVQPEGRCRISGPAVLARVDGDRRAQLA